MTLDKMSWVDVTHLGSYWQIEMQIGTGLYRHRANPYRIKRDQNRLHPALCIPWIDGPPPSGEKNELEPQNPTITRW